MLSPCEHGKEREESPDKGEGGLERDRKVVSCR